MTRILDVTPLNTKPFSSLRRIFIENKITMDNQYCKVGASTPITSGSNAGSTIERYYQRFASMASDTQYAGTRMGEFFERKARTLKRTLEEFV
jgi:hypothetical protein